MKKRKTKRKAKKTDRIAADITMILHDAMWAQEQYGMHQKLKRGATSFKVEDDSDTYAVIVTKLPR